jgi:N-acetylmuramic acid 6-phosphate etherase
MSDASERARHFLEKERPFRLGALPTESPHPKTTRLSRTLERDTRRGIAMLLDVDRDIPPAAARAFGSESFGRLVEAIAEAVSRGNRVYFTGCGATGRLSILLEAAWRRFFQEAARRWPAIAPRFSDLQDAARSVMAGGDYALIRSVEGFEDFADFGKHQIAEAGVRAGDVVVAITEGGETSFVIGTAWKAIEVGAAALFVYNNPTDVLREQVERSRHVIDEPRITKLDLSSGPMAVAGSTRMQATTAELLVVGAAVEMALGEVLRRRVGDETAADLGLVVRRPEECVRLFTELLDELASAEAVTAMAALTEFEEGIYRRRGLVTYLADEFLLDVLTDTTERSPTFRCPPFRKRDDRESARSWAFVKNPMFATVDAWGQVFRRPPRGLAWTAETYRALGAPESLRAAPPKLDSAEILKFAIGNELDPSRWEAADSAVVAIRVGLETDEASVAAARFKEAAVAQMTHYARREALSIGPARVDWPGAESFHVPCRPADSPLGLWEHLAVKMVLNTISTATMARLGRVRGNRMVYVETSNKKLVDRAIRLVSELAEVSYEEACLALHETMEELKARPRGAGDDPPAAVVLTIERLATRSNAGENNA